MDWDGLKMDMDGLKDLTVDLNGLEKLKELKYVDFDGFKDIQIDFDGLKALKMDFEGIKPFKFEGKVFNGKSFAFATRNQGDLARMFERCDAQRGNPEEQEDRFYDCGRRAIDESQWDRAVDYFTRAAAVKGDRADGALYWKAYSQNRLGQRAEALTTLAELKNGFAKSRWTNDASALEVEVRQRSGQKVDPANTSDDELKLLALNALGDSPEAVPMLERLLAGPQSPKLKERALFVLAQNQNPAARAVVIKIAKGGGNPELQYRAIQYVGRTRTPESREVLAQAYGTTADPGVKRMIIRTYMEAQDRERLLALARTETDPALRVAAVRELGNMRAGTELSELYLRETSPEVKKQILRAMANGGSIDRLITVVDSEKDPELKRTAIRTIGTNRDTGPQLVNFYTKDTNQEVRKAVIDALFTQGNATALVTIARKETDIELKKSLVSRLGNMRDSPEAKAYLLELIGK
jgi:tetratricopeptide (TPR) repeat protein